QLGTFEDDEAVVECVALVGFGKTAGDDAWDTFKFQGRGRLFATRTASEVQSAHYNVALLIKRIEIRIIVFEGDRGHLLGSHVVAVSVSAPVNAVGIQIIFVDKKNPAAHARRKTFHDLHGPGRPRFFLGASGRSACGALAKVCRRRNKPSQSAGGYDG